MRFSKAADLQQDYMRFSSPLLNVTGSNNFLDMTVPPGYTIANTRVLINTAN
jgi:hypothetical protein